MLGITEGCIVPLLGQSSPIQRDAAHLIMEICTPFRISETSEDPDLTNGGPHCCDVIGLQREDDLVHRLDPLFCIKHDLVVLTPYMIGHLKEHTEA